MKDKKDKIYYFQEKSNDILDLQDELTAEEIGIYFILKAGYFKYSGELKKENANQRCKFFGDINKFNLMILKLFDEVDGLLINNSWLSEINGIKDLSKKRKEIAESRWKKPQDNPKITPNLTPNKNVNEEFKSELINHNLDFQEFWGNYPLQKTKVKGSKATSEKKYNLLREKGISKEELSNALANYQEEIKTNSWQQTKRVEFWLTKWEAYRQEDYSKELKFIESEVKKIEPLASIQVKDKNIIIKLPTFDSFRLNKEIINKNLKMFCENIGYKMQLIN